MSMSKKLGAEFIGTFWLVLGGCGSAVLAAGISRDGNRVSGCGAGFRPDSVLTMAFAIGHISGCHINPAVSVGLMVGGRFPAGELVPYVVVQVLGGIAGGAVLYVIASGQPGFELGGFASNGYGEHSPGGYSPGGLPGGRSGDDLYVSYHHSRRHRQACACWPGSNCYWSWPYFDPPDHNPRDEHLGESRLAVLALRYLRAVGPCLNCGCSGLRPLSGRPWPGWFTAGWAARTESVTGCSWRCARYLSGCIILLFWVVELTARNSALSADYFLLVT